MPKREIVARTFGISAGVLVWVVVSTVYLDTLSIHLFVSDSSIMPWILVGSSSLW